MSIIRDTVLRTKSTKYNKAHVAVTRLSWALQDMRKAGIQVNALKKDLFYKDPEQLTPVNIPMSDYMNPLAGEADAERDIMHGILGVFDEAAEIAEALFQFYTKGMNRRDFHDNLVEELGDLLWFIDLATQGLGVDIETLMNVNAAKLQKRYPKAFSSKDALNRDKEGEAQAMREASKRKASDA